MKIITNFIILFTILLGVVEMGSAKPNLTKMLSDSINGWQVEAPDQSYNQENLFDYINGGAELYLSYGFQKLLSRTYSRSEQPNIIVDLFDMGSARDAFGVFSHSREEVDTTFGQGSQYTSGLLMFWKDRYFISILASPETPESKKAVFELAGFIENKIPVEGALPDILDRLPQKKLIRESIRFFHHHIWLNSHYFIADENILNIGDSTDVVLAKYRDGEERIILLVIEYPDAKAMQNALNSFRKYYLPEVSAKDKMVKMEDGSWTAFREEGNLLAIAFNASTDQKASSLIDAVFQ